MSTATNDSTTPTNTRPQTVDPSGTQAITDFAALFAMVDSDTAQRATLTGRQSALQALAETLNELSNEGLTVWREGDQWRWHWRGTRLWADMQRLGLGDAVLDALDARQAISPGVSLI
ncbi:MAG TPA: hypothetical protein VFS21_01900 [Roseiflexaceae bacterium]|nr:hypothetical protein [Roseiflexaceae bacterium]